MTEHWISADDVFDGYTLHADHALSIEGGIVTGLSPTRALPASAEPIHHQGLLSPGFFDIQVNGGGGALLNSDPTPNGIETLVKAHRGLGTTALLPTVITDAPEVIEAAAEACLKARTARGVMGLHIEGPHLSLARRGTHKPEFIRPMDQRSLDLIAHLRAADLPVLITVAPETTTPVQIQTLVGMGAIVSIGHSDATAEGAAACVAAGATCFTHLFNAMSPMLHRAPGITGAAIGSEAYCSIIADGIHVDPMMVSLAIRARPVADKMIAVSDAMATIGGPDTFELYGREIQLRDGRLVNDDGALAGAHLTMCDAVRNLVSYGVPKEQALRMGRHNPAQLMGLWPDMQLIGTPVDDILMLSADLELEAVGLNPVG